jgi:glyoxylase-like metal-dependent hydrolase (beta-lactamase superfamily II)
VPGHTRGSQALLWNGTLFTGDHLWGSDAGDGLEASRSVCWYSWAAQLRSIERLLAHDFARVLPGHGRRLERPDAASMRTELRALLQRSR